MSAPPARAWKCPTGYARALFNFLNEMRTADSSCLPASVVGAPPKPSDAQLNAYLQAHHDAFSTPEYREVDFAWIAPQDLAGKMKVTDAQIKQQYEAEQAKYLIPEKRQLEQITFPDLASAKAARAKINSGTSFADLARQRGLNPNDIQIGTLTKADLADRAGAVFGVAKGGVTQPLKAPIGYALVHVVDITPGKTTTLQDAKEELRKELASQLAASKIADIANQYIDENSRGQSLSQAATRTGMHVGHVAEIDAHGLAPDGSKGPDSLRPRSAGADFQGGRR